jgi:SH3-like domain-containing protein
VPPSTPGAAPLPAANAEVDASGTNKVRIEPRAYQATVQVVALNVRTKPGMHGQVFVVVHQGDVLDVAGFTHNWAAADINGRLGFVHRTMISAP